MPNLHLDHNTCFALCSHPDDDDILLYQSDTLTTQSVKQISSTQDQFVFAPFDNNNSCYSITSERQTLPEDTTINISFDCLNKNVYSVEKEEYKSNLLSYLSSFNTEFSKAILSRIKTTDINLYDVNIWSLFNALKDQYPNAFTYVLHTPEFGLWLGASPEVLLKEDERTLMTTALAGSQAYQEHVVWGEKEKEEQAIVERYIEQQLKDLELSFNKTEPYTSRAGNLAHIKTDFTVDSNGRFNDVLNRLHPTPAVCGLPTEKAKFLIQSVEQHDRVLYTGFIGTVDRNSKVYVNLRCMQLLTNKACAYVGGGITKDSDPESEWIETELKAETMLSVLEKVRNLHP